MPAETIDSFRTRSLAAGADEVVERRWEAGKVAETHTHPFDADALVTDGEMWLTCGDDTRHLRPGDTFQLRAGTPHAERYGPLGAVYWMARRNAR